MHILANFVIFDDFRPFLIEKWTFWTTFEDLEQPPVQKSRYICLQPQGPSQNLLKTLSKPPIFDHFGPLWGSGERVADIRPNKMALFDLVRNDTKWCKYVQNLLPALLKLPCANWGTKTTILHFWHPVFGPLFLTSRTKMLICSALIDGPQNRPQKP